ncbi:MAG: sulfurtransferase [Methanomassiliicoccales archaeon]
MEDRRIEWVSSKWLMDNLDEELKIIDCQPNVHDYVRRHIPGAAYLAEENLRIMQDSIPHRWLEGQMAAKIFSQLGLSNDIPVVVYTSIKPAVPTGDGVPQSMIAYSLVRYGHKKVLILDGGLDEWLKNGGQTTQTLPKIKKGDFRPMIDTSLPMTYVEFISRKDGEDVIHIDSRSGEQYEGESVWSKKGHIPGSINIPWSSSFQPHNLALLRPKEEIIEIFSQSRVVPEKEIICHCGTGRKAAAQLVVLRWLLGYPRVRLFEGSFTEWCRYEENETVIGFRPR